MLHIFTIVATNREKNEKKLVGLALTAVASFCFSQQASAAFITANDQFNTGGTLNALGAVTPDTATGIDFTSGPTSSPGTPGALVGGTGTGDFAVLNTGAFAGSIKDILDFGTFTDTASFFTFMAGGSTLTFSLNSPLTINRIPGTGTNLSSLLVSGAGNIFLTGFDATPGILTLSTQGNNSSTFSLSTTALAVAAVPEPASTALLGLGLMGLIFARRRSTKK